MPVRGQEGRWGSVPAGSARRTGSSGTPGSEAARGRPGLCGQQAPCRALASLQPHGPTGHDWAGAQGALGGRGGTQDPAPRQQATSPGRPPPRASPWSLGPVVLKCQGGLRSPTVHTLTSPSLEAPCARRSGGLRGPRARAPPWMPESHSPLSPSFLHRKAQHRPKRDSVCVEEQELSLSPGSGLVPAFTASVTF